MPFDRWFRPGKPHGDSEKDFTSAGSHQLWLRRYEADENQIVAVKWVALTFVLCLSTGERRPSGQHHRSGLATSHDDNVNDAVHKAGSRREVLYSRVTTKPRRSYER